MPAQGEASSEILRISREKGTSLHLVMLALNTVQGERFKENLLKKIKVYVGVDEDDDEPVFYWRLFSSSQDTMPRRVDDEGEYRRNPRAWL